MGSHTSTDPNRALSDLYQPPFSIAPGSRAAALAAGSTQAGEWRDLGRRRADAMALLGARCTLRHDFDLAGLSEIDAALHEAANADLHFWSRYAKQIS